MSFQKYFLNLVGDDLLQSFNVFLIASCFFIVNTD